MKNSLFLPLLFLSFSALSQTTPYKEFEVDTAAEPRGGIAFVNTFIQATLRKPIPAQASGIGGRVIVEGVVEPDGHISNAKAIQRFRPDCDREAVRVFSLFNAWKPAQKNGQAVRQRVTIPVTFQPNAPFTYVNGTRITYFEADSKVTADSSQAKYKQIAPIDTNGVPTGDIVVYESKGKGWKEYFKLPLVRHKNNANAAGLTRYTVGNQTYKQDWEGPLFVINEAGTIVEQSLYRDGKRSGIELRFHENGAIAEKTDERDDARAIITWYANGQIRQIRSVPKFNPSTPNRPEQVTAYWDSQGNPTVKDGNGQAVYEMTTTSRVDTTKQTQLIERGFYENGFRQGVWTGRYADGSYFYEERYDKGVCTGGKAAKAGADTIWYNDLGTPPEFSGGMNGLAQFLSQNLSYPVAAHKAGAQGKVFVSFVVCTDGTLCDYEVLKSVQPDLDREAVRVIQKMSGKWKPGIQRGEKVRVKYNLPINFTLQ